MKIAELNFLRRHITCWEINVKQRWIRLNVNRISKTSRFFFNNANMETHHADKFVIHAIQKCRWNRNLRDRMINGLTIEIKLKHASNTKHTELLIRTFKIAKKFIVNGRHKYWNIKYTSCKYFLTLLFVISKIALNKNDNSERLNYLGNVRYYITPHINEKNVYDIKHLNYVTIFVLNIQPIYIKMLKKLFYFDR